MPKIKKRATASYKKITILIVLINVALIAALALRILKLKRASSEKGSQPTTNLPAQAGNKQLTTSPSWKPSDYNLPESDKIEITGVTMNNFYKIAPNPPGKQIGDTTIVDQPLYKIIYYPIDKGFLIPILGSPFLTIKSEAEQKFIDVLGISKEDACKLLVVATTPSYVNPAEAGREYKLSWCSP